MINLIDYLNSTEHYSNYSADRNHICSNSKRQQVQYFITVHQVYGVYAIRFVLFVHLKRS